MRHCIFYYITILVIFCSFTHKPVIAQNISVSKFYLADNDMSAIDNSVLDQNGNKCALIRVQTTQKGFVYDVGSLGVKKVDDTKVGEIWVYVPAGVKHIDIRHSSLGNLVGYNFNISIQSARTYIMELVTGEVQTVIKKAVTSQYILFDINPKNATVEIDGNVLETIDGTATIRKQFGTYSYRVFAPKHKTEIGSVEVNDPNSKHIININLEPQFKKVVLNAQDGTEVWLNGTYLASGTCSSDLDFGTYLVETQKSGHNSTSQEITIDENTIANIELEEPQPIYGSIDINSTPANANVYLDGKNVGTTPLVLDNVLVGNHEIIIKKDRFSNYSTQVEIKENEESQITASLGQEITVCFSVNKIKETTYLYIDGDKKGKIEGKYITTLSPGKHDILISGIYGDYYHKEHDLNTNNEFISIEINSIQEKYESHKIAPEVVSIYSASTDMSSYKYVGIIKEKYNGASLIGAINENNRKRCIQRLKKEAAKNNCTKIQIIDEQIINFWGSDFTQLTAKMYK